MPVFGSTVLGATELVDASGLAEAGPGSSSSGMLSALASQPVAIDDAGGVLAMNAHTYEAQSLPGLGSCRFVGGETGGELEFSLVWPRCPMNDHAYVAQSMPPRRGAGAQGTG